MSGDEACSYADQDWQFWDDIDPTAPVLVCDVHGLPAWGEVYECEPGQETGPCQRLPRPDR